MDRQKRYFIITGMGRTGTTWLASILNQHANCFCTHEAFRPPTWPEAFDEWKKADAPVVGDVNSYARFFLSQLEEDLHPDWVFCWRDPLQLIHSIIARGGSAFNWNHRVYTRSRFDFKLRIVATWFLGDLEVMLSRAQKLGITAANWHFDHYTTNNGVLELAEHLGLQFDKPPIFDVFQNTYQNPQRGKLNLLPTPLLRFTKTPPQKIPHYSQWSHEEQRVVLDIFESLTLVNKAYQESKQRMKDSCSIDHAK